MMKEVVQCPGEKVYKFGLDWFASDGLAFFCDTLIGVAI